MSGLRENLAEAAALSTAGVSGPEVGGGGAALSSADRKSFTLAAWAVWRLMDGRDGW